VQSITLLSVQERTIFREDSSRSASSSPVTAAGRL
jgi:hypothetical protein